MPDYHENGVLRKSWNHETRTYTEYDAYGNAISSRPYTLEENNTADAELNMRAAELNRAIIRDLTRIQNAINTNNNFVALSAPTAAQVVSYLKVIAKQLNGLLRLQRQELLTDISDTY